MIEPSYTFDGNEALDMGMFAERTIAHLRAPTLERTFQERFACASAFIPPSGADDNKQDVSGKGKGRASAFPAPVPPPVFLSTFREFLQQCPPGSFESQLYEQACSDQVSPESGDDFLHELESSDWATDEDDGIRVVERGYGHINDMKPLFMKMFEGADIGLGLQDFLAEGLHNTIKDRVSDVEYTDVELGPFLVTLNGGEGAEPPRPMLRPLFTARFDSTNEDVLDPSQDARAIAELFRTLPFPPIPLATAADLPLDILPLIAEQVAEGLSPTVRLNRTQKRALSDCSLVLRDWANKCRDWIFWHLILRSSSDLRELQAMLECRGQRRIIHFKKYVHALHICVTGPYRPWIQDLEIALHRRILKHCSSDLKLFFDLDDPDLAVGGANMTRGFTSVHHLSPVPLPSRLLSRFETLSFSNVHFPSFGHLLRVVDELPSLVNLKCYQVTWDSTARMPPQRIVSRWRESQALQWIASQGCTDTGKFLQAISRKIIKGGYYAVRDVDLSLILDLIRCCTSARWNRWVWIPWNIIATQPESSHEGEVCMNYNVTKLEGADPVVTFCTVHGQDAPMFGVTLSTARTPLPLCVRYIIVKPIYFTVQEGIGFNWEVFVETALQLSGLYGVVIGFLDKSALQWFMSSHGQHVKPLEGAGKLAYAMLCRDQSWEPIEWTRLELNGNMPDDGLAAGHRNTLDAGLQDLCAQIWP